MKLEEISEIMIGILAKREEEKNGKNSYSLFSLKNYQEEQEYEQFRTNKDFNNKLAQKGDLLFRLLYPNKIIYVDETIEGTLIPSQFCIIRPKKQIVDSIFLKWYLENKKTEKELKSKITGSIIKTMTIANLKTLKIEITSIEEQEKMKELILLWEKEKEISKKIIEEKEKLYNFYLEEIIESRKNK